MKLSRLFRGAAAALLAFAVSCAPVMAAPGVVAANLTKEVCANPTVTPTNSYGQNFVVGGVLRFQNVFVASAGTGLLVSVAANMKKVEASGFTFVPLKAAPSAQSTFNDAAVAAINAADVDLVREPVSLNSFSGLGTHTIVYADQIAELLNVGKGNTDLYGILLSNGSLTNQFASTTDVTSVCVKVFADF